MSAGLDRHTRILVANDSSILGRALVRCMRADGFDRVHGSGAADLGDPHAVRALYSERSPDVVFATGGLSGGIHANLAEPADLMVSNLGAALHPIHEAHRAGIQRLVYVGSSCCYPVDCPQPMNEEALFTGALEPSSAPYATARIAGMRLVQAIRRQHGRRYVSAIPGDMYGPHDDFAPERSHVVAALLVRFRAAAAQGLDEVAVWGSGLPRRDFAFVDDVARGLVFLAAHYDDDLPINVGSGSGHTIRDLAEAVAAATGFRGRLVFDRSKPDGMPLKVLDSQRLSALGYAHRTELCDGLRLTLEWLQSQE